MPKVDPIQYLMSALTTLTGGLIADMQSLILGLVVCSFIFMGLDHLMDVFGSIINNYRSDKYMKDAHAFLDERNNHDRSSAEYAYNNQIYQRLVRKSVDLKMKKWRHDDY